MLSAVRVYEEVQAAGYEGRYTQVKEYVRQVRPSTHEAVVRFETAVIPSCAKTRPLLIDHRSAARYCAGSSIRRAHGSTTRGTTAAAKATMPRTWTRTC